MEAGLVRLHIEGERGEVVGKGIDQRIGFHRGDLEAAVARGAGFGLDGGAKCGGLAGGAEVGDVAGVPTGHTLVAGDLPFAGAQAAGGVAHALPGGVDAQDGRNRLRAAGRAQAAFETGRNVAGLKGQRAGGPQHLQAGADQRREGEFDRIAEVFFGTQDRAGQGVEALGGKIRQFGDGVLQAGGRVGYHFGGEGMQYVDPLGGHRAALGVEGRDAVLTAAGEMGGVGSGFFLECVAVAVEHVLLGVGEACGEGEKIFHRVALGQLAQTFGAGGKDPAGRQALAGIFTTGWDDDFFGVEKFLHGGLRWVERSCRGISDSPRQGGRVCRSPADTAPAAAWQG